MTWRWEIFDGLWGVIRVWTILLIIGLLLTAWVMAFLIHYLPKLSWIPQPFVFMSHPPPLHT